MAFRVWMVGLVASALVVAPAAGQETMVLELLDEGKPVSNAPVRDETGRTVGTTGGNGEVAFDMSMLDFGKGERVQVWVKECEDGRVEVILAAADSDDPCADEDAGAGERCGCRKVGAPFLWDGGRVVVDVGAGTVTHVPAAPGGDFAGNTPPHLIGLGGGLSYFSNLEDAVMDVPGLIGSDSDPLAPMFQGVYEVRPTTRLPLSIGAEFQYARLSEITQTFAGGPGEPTMSMLDQDVFSMGLYGAYRPPPHFRNRTSFWPGVGVWWVYNSAEIETMFEGADEPAFEDRSESGLRAGLRFGVDHYFTHRAGIRFDAGYTFGAGDDADTNLSAAAKLIWLPKPWRAREWRAE